MLAVRVLGPLSVTIDDREVTPASVRQRRLLAALVLRVGRPVSMDALVDAVWGERPPRSAVNSAQSYVSRLRGLLGPAVLAWTGSGYELGVDPAAVDAYRFEALVDQARSAADPRAALGLLDAALALWNDRPYPELAHYEPALAQAARLTEVYLTGRELRSGAMLAAGQLPEAIASLYELTVQYPLREQPWHQLMSALHRNGQQADALAAFRRYDEFLAEQGLEPQGPIRDLRTAILAAPGSVRTGPAPTTAADRPAVGVPAQLPAPAAAFVGRHEQLRSLDDLLARGPGPALAIAAVAGSAGVGKTAVAVRWAHRVRDRFPDGQLFVDLRGFATGEPVRPIDALTGFLAGLGVAPERCPVELDQARALYRSLLAGRRLLVVLDNAAGVEQVRPLLPGEPGCFVLITSRDRLGGLIARDGAQPFRLHPLSPDEAGELLSRLLGESRVAEDRESTVDLAATCAYLPLALRVAAAALTAEPDWPVHDYVKRLHDDRLNTLVVEGDPESTVGVAFDASYRALPVAAQRLFRLLGLVPGPDISVAAAAALAGLPGPEAERLLDRLAAAHLLDRPAHGRYSCHDLLRAYAHESCRRIDPPADREAATTRLYEWYESGVDAAADLLYPHMLRLPRPARNPISDAGAGTHAAALAWLDAERRNLVALVRHAGPGAHRCRLADGMRGYFHLGRHTAEWIAVAEAALTAAEGIGDRLAQEAARHSLGTAYRSIGDRSGALHQYARALWLARRCGWRDAEATTLGNLGMIHHAQGRLDAAVARLTRAIAIDRSTGRRAGVANNLGLLGDVHLDQGRFAEARAAYGEALELNRVAGNVHGQALARTGLRQISLASGRPAEAFGWFADALAGYTKVGDRDGQAVIHHRMSVVEGDRGRVRAARAHAVRALDLARAAGDPRTEADSLAALGAVLGREGRHRAASERYQQAYALAPHSSPRHEIEALTGLARSAWELGDLAEADRYARAAADHAARCGYRPAEARARTTLDLVQRSGSGRMHASCTRPGLC
ncbi:AfsR/SARP family transcriptional regulator [Actinoplanes nipponensis]|nr:tetratricopeptide repeat protein [Actinoplanes nipponensis]